VRAVNLSDFATRFLIRRVLFCGVRSISRYGCVSSDLLLLAATRTPVSAFGSDAPDPNHCGLLLTFLISCRLLQRCQLSSSSPLFVPPRDHHVLTRVFCFEDPQPPSLLTSPLPFLIVSLNTLTHGFLFSFPKTAHSEKALCEFSC